MTKTVVLTGATSGVGAGCVTTLREAGWRIVALVRSRAPEGTEGIECDLASLESVREASARVLESCPRIDVLLGCAGVAPWERRESADGFELAWATNVLGHALLFERLRARLVESAPARVLMISGDAHRRGRIHWDDLQLREGYSAMNAGTQAALGKILWTYAIARELEGTGVTVNTFCPAFVRGRLTRDFPGWMQPLVAVGNLFAQSPVKGARTPVWLATDAALEGVSGRYFRHRAPRESSSESHDVEAQSRLLAEIRRSIGEASA